MLVDGIWWDQNRGGEIILAGRKIILTGGEIILAGENVFLADRKIILAGGIFLFFFIF